MSTARDFDFLHGTWRVDHRKLRERLAGCTEWLALTGTADVRAILGGIGNFDTLRIDGDDFQGATLRLFDLEEKVWRIHWADTRRGRLDPPLTGTFVDGVGTFFGDDTFSGRAIRLRFIWRDLGPSEASWEQAFSDDGGRTWETNWTMRFHRLPS